MPALAHGPHIGARLTCTQAPVSVIFFSLTDNINQQATSQSDLIRLHKKADISELHVAICCCRLSTKFHLGSLNIQKYPCILHPKQQHVVAHILHPLVHAERAARKRAKSELKLTTRPGCESILSCAAAKRSSQRQGYVGRSIMCRDQDGIAFGADPLAPSDRLLGWRARPSPAQRIHS